MKAFFCAAVLFTAVVLVGCGGSKENTGTGGGSGGSAGSASVSLAEGATVDFGTSFTGATVEKLLTVQNTGDGAADALSVSLSGTSSFGFKGDSAPGVGGTCAGSLAAGATCTVALVFHSSSAGVATGSLAVGYTGASTPLSVTLTGKAVSPAQLRFTEAPSFSYGTVGVASSNDHTFTLTNDSADTAATALSTDPLTAPFAFKGGSFPGQGGTCAISLATSASCSIVVTYAPTTSGTAAGTLTAHYATGAGQAAAAISLAGSAVNTALLTYSDGTTYGFGSLAVGAVATHTLTVQNNTTAPATSLSVALPTGVTAVSGASTACGSSLGAGGTCTIDVRWAPNAAGALSGDVNVSYFDGVATQSAAITLGGTATTPASLQLAEAPSFAFGTVAQTATAEHTFTLTNTGGTAATSLAGAALASPFAYKDGAFPGSGGTCGQTLAAGTSCTLVVRYTAGAVGADAATLTVSYNDGAASQSVACALSGTSATKANLNLTPSGSGYTFAATTLGASTDATFTLDNSGGVAATALNISVSGGGFSFKGGTFPGQGGTCTAAVTPGASCTFVVTFAPQASGPLSGQLSGVWNDGVVTVAPNTLPLSGTGRTPAALALSGSGTFPTTAIGGGQSTTTLTVQNSGGTDASGLQNTLGAPFAVASGSTCGAVLTAGASCSLVVKFAPTSTGLAGTNLTVNFNDGAQAASTTPFALSGTGANPANVTFVDGASYDFNKVAQGGSKTLAFSVQNTGGVDATGMTFSHSQAPQFVIDSNTCGATLSPNASCVVTVSFRPDALSGFSDNLVFTLNDGAQSRTPSISLAGLGAKPAALSFSDASPFVFTSVVVGNTTNHVFTVQNTGEVPADNLAFSSLTAPFGYTGGAFPGTNGTCGRTLAGGASCTIDVSAAPSSPGAQSLSVVVGYDTGVASTSVLENLSVTGLRPAQLAFAQAPVLDLGRALANSTPINRSATLTNSGDVAATSLQIAALPPPFSFNGGTFPGTNGTCGLTLNPGSSCTLDLLFAPTAVGLFNATLQTTFVDGHQSASATLNLKGEGRAPASLQFLDGVSFDYGSVGSGRTADHVFYVSNTGGWPAGNLGASLTGAAFSFKGGTFPGLGGTCGSQLADGSVCSIIVRFTASAGSQSGTIDCTYDDGTQPNVAASIALTGLGTSSAVLSVTDFPSNYYTQYGLAPDPAVFSYGTTGVATNTDHVFSITNGGGGAASGLAGVAFGDAAFSFKGGTFPGAGGTCASTLAVGDSCQVVVTFTPPDQSARSASLQVSYNDGAGPQVAARTLTGSGLDAAVVSISDFREGSIGPVFDMGAWGLGKGSDHGFFVRNRGTKTALNLAATVAGAGFTLKGDAYPGIGGTCGSTLPAGSECTVYVSYTASIIGGQSGSLDVTYDDNAGNTNVAVSRAISGTGVQTALLAFTSRGGPSNLVYDYGTHATGAATDNTFTVTNNGSAPATALSLAPLAVGYQPKGNTCGAQLLPGQSCDVTVTFTPNAAGDFESGLSFSYSDGQTQRTVSMSLLGHGTVDAYLFISDSSNQTREQVNPIDLGVVGSTQSGQLAIINAGAAATTSISGAFTGSGFGFVGGTFPGTGGDCGNVLAANSSCHVAVTFNGTADGQYSSLLQITYVSNGNTRTTQRQFLATKTSKAFLTVSDCQSCNGGNNNSNSTDFGTTGVPADRVLYVQNVGAVGATAVSGALTGPFTFKGGSFPGTGGNCSSTLLTGTTCQLVVVFTPPPNGPANGVLTLSYNDSASTTTATRALTGAGTDRAALRLGEFTGGFTNGQPRYDFGTAGSPTDRQLYLYNTGGADASALTPNPLNGAFTFKGGAFPGQGGTCSTQALPKGQGCTLVVTFTPTGNLTVQDVVSISYNDPFGQQTVSRGVMGTGSTTALINIYDSQFGGQNQGPFNYGTAGTAVDHTFTVRNEGGGDANNLADALNMVSGVFSFPGGYPGAGGSCSAFLARGNSCTIVVRFSPPGDGTFNGSLDLSYGSGQHATRALVATGTTVAVLTVHDGPNAPPAGQFPFDFGTWGTNINHTFELHNDGAQNATSLSEAAPLPPGFRWLGGAGFPGQGGSCSTATPLPPGQVCTVVVEFVPAGDQVWSGQFSISYGNGASTQQVSRAITGTSTTQPLLNISDFGGGNPPGPFDFGLAGPSGTSHRFYLFNSGGAPADITPSTNFGGPFSWTGGTFPGSGGTCSSPIPAGVNCMIFVTFAPPGPGPFSGQITINYTNATAPQLVVTRQLTGTGAAGAILVINDFPNGGFSGNAYDFGTTGTNTRHVFEVRNNGSQSATGLAPVGGIGAEFVYSGTGYPGAAGSCGAQLAPGTACNIEVEFQPSGSGLQQGLITLGYNDGTGQLTQAKRNVQGTAINGALLGVSDFPDGNNSNPSAYDFGTAGTPISRTFYVKNRGNQTASSLTGVSFGPGFGWTGGQFPGTNGNCVAGGLAPGGVCQVDVQFQPSGTTTFSGSVTVSYFDGTATQTASRTVMGTSTTNAQLSILPFTGSGNFQGAFDYGTWGVPTNHVFTVTNTGAATATAIAARPLGAGFTFVPQSGSCGSTLAANSSCTLTVSFTPNGTQTFSSAIALDYGNGTTTATAFRDVRGTSTDRGYVRINDFPDVGCGDACGPVNAGSGPSGQPNPPVTLYVFNHGARAATFTISPPPSADFAIVSSSNTCGASLAPGGQCSFQVQFTATSAGVKTYAVTVSPDDGVQPLLSTDTRTLQGTGL